MKVYIRMLVLAVGIMTLTFCVSASISHPPYLQARENLRAARVMIEHRMGDRASTLNENEAVHQIDGAIIELNYAAADPDTSLEWHPAQDADVDHPERLHQALGFLNEARAQVAQEENNYFAKSLQHNTIIHIDSAIRATARALIE